MPQVLLISPPIRDYYLTRKRTIPYGLALLADRLRDAQFSVELIDCLATAKSRPLPRPSYFAHLDDFYRPDISPWALFQRYQHFGFSQQHLRERLLRLRSNPPMLIGISSLFTAYAEQAHEAAALVKNIFPAAIVVMGGHHPTALPQIVLEDLSVDFVIRGAGEQSLIRLAQLAQDKQIFNDQLIPIPGLCYRRPDGSLHLSEPAPWLAEQNRTARPAFDLINEKYYARACGKTAVIVASRGCPLHCSYCAVSADAQPGYHRRAIKEILEELAAAIIERGVRFVDFEDENISFDRHWFNELLAGLKEKFSTYRVEFRAMNGLLPQTLDDPTIALMASAGFSELNLSLGSSSAKQLRAFGRPAATITAFDAALEAASRHGLRAVGYVIIGAPGQSPGSSLEDLLFLAKRRVLAGLAVYYPAPGSLDFNQLSQKGLLPESFALFRSSAICLGDAKSRLATVTLLRLGRLVNFAKQLADEKIPWPAADCCRLERIELPLNRQTAGINLLSWFLNDYQLRGINPSGEIYLHSAEDALTQTLAQAISASPPRGTN